MEEKGELPNFHIITPLSQSTSIIALSFFSEHLYNLTSSFHLCIHFFIVWFPSLEFQLGLGEGGCVSFKNIIIWSTVPDHWHTLNVLGWMNKYWFGIFPLSVLVGGGLGVWGNWCWANVPDLASLWNCNSLKYLVGLCFVIPNQFNDLVFKTHGSG